MKFIPDGIKRLFSRKSRKQDEAAPAASAEALEAVPVAPPPVNNRLGALAFYKQPEGHYIINLDVKVPGHSRQGQILHMIQAQEADFLLALLSPQYMAGAKAVAMEVEEHMLRTFGLDVGHVYFKRKDANFFFDGYDQLRGLPPGDGFQLVLVPEGCDWKPDYVPPLQYAIPNTGTVLQHPATLLPQFARNPPYQIIMVNGFDIRTPQLPDMPQAQPKEEPKPARAAAPKP